MPTPIVFPPRLPLNGTARPGARGSAAPVAGPGPQAPRGAAGPAPLSAQGANAKASIVQNFLRWFSPAKAQAAVPMGGGAPVGGGGTSSYTVQAGDTLGTIAQNTLGDASRWQDIYNANTDQISNPNIIFPGQVLQIPGGSAPSTGSGGTYTVQSGDSLSSIAQQTLGDAGRWQDIYNANANQISDPNVIYAGEVLQLPGDSAPAPAAPAPAPAPAAPATYTVQSGDSLSSIAQQTLGDAGRWQEIYNLNTDQLSDPNVISAGQVLKLPNGANTAPAAAPSSSAFGDQAVGAARQLMANGYHYTVNLTSEYNPVRFQVGCCADFAVDSWARAGIDLYNRVSNPHYCPTLVNYFQSGADGHQWVGPNQACRPGDMVFFDWGDGEADHVAIVSSVGPDGKPASIIESYDFNLPVHEAQIGAGSKNCIIGYGRA